MSGTVYIGTSGWSYDHWSGPFYPDSLPEEERLSWYAGRLNSVEINATFYHLPRPETLARWQRHVGSAFLFSVKAGRYITHMKKLKDPEEPVRTFLDRIQRLHPNLGPVLFQLPPHWKRNTGRLREFLNILPRRNRYVFEFRNSTWWHESVYDVLRSRNCAFCIFELAGEITPKRVTADFVYIRLHGPGSAYEGRYGKRALSGWAGAISAWSRSGLPVYCYFDNDQKGYAASDAQDLSAMLATGST